MPRNAEPSEQRIAVGPVLPPALGEAIKAAFREQNYAALVEQLEFIIGLTITGLLVYGSMAKDPRSVLAAKSDVDLLVLVEANASGGVFGRAGDVDMDLHVQTRRETLGDSAVNWIYADAAVLFDARPPELNLWLNGLAMWKLKNPDPWTETDHVRSYVWAHRLVERVIKLSATDPAGAAIHEARLLANISMLYAQVKRRRTTSISKWWAILQHEDCVFADALTSYLSKRTYPPDGEALRCLVNALYTLPKTAIMNKTRDT